MTQDFMPYKQELQLSLQNVSGAIGPTNDGVNEVQCLLIGRLYVI